MHTLDLILFRTFDYQKFVKKKLGGNHAKYKSKKEGLECRLYKELLHSIIKCSLQLVCNSLRWRGQLNRGRRDAGNLPPVKNKGLAVRLPRRLLEGEDRK